MLFQPRQRIVFIGDSITDSGRSINAPYGSGYVSLVRGFVTAAHPELSLSWVNRGVSGDTVRDLKQRWARDAIGSAPDWLSVMIGINDVWQIFVGGSARAVPIEEYEQTQRHLCRDAVEQTGCRLILADPYVIEPDRSDPWRATSDRYGAVVRRLAEELDAVHIATQRAFDAVLASTKTTDWADDRVHPNLSGHAVIAQEYLRTIDPEHWR